MSSTPSLTVGVATSSQGWGECLPYFAASDGQHILSVYVHYAPRFLVEGTWAEQRDALYRSVIDTLTTQAPGIAGLVLEREVITPEDLETQWGFSGGHIFHGDLAWPWANPRSLMDTPAHRWGVQTVVPNVVIAGAGAQRGGGVSGIGGHNAAMAVLDTIAGRL